METRQVRLPKAHEKLLIVLVKRGMYPSVSEAVRTSVRELLIRHGLLETKR